MSDGAADGPRPGASSAPPPRRRLLERVAGMGISAQAAVPGLYAWAITVAPAAWSRGAPLLAQIASIVGVTALLTAPLVEGRPGPVASPEAKSMPRPRSLVAIRAWSNRTWARVWSVWGFVLSSALVWLLVPSALSPPRLDAVRGALGMVGWALFAFASAGPALQRDPHAAGRIIASTALKPRNELPGGDGVYVTIGVVLALAMQAVGWGVAVPERAVLVRLITVVCGIAVLGGMTSIALARHGRRVAASRRVRLRRALPWLVMLVLFAGAGLALSMAR